MTSKLCSHLLSASAALVVVSAPSTATAAQPQRESVKPVFAHDISNVPGKKLVSVVVSYPPGAKSLSHHHAGSAFIFAYVLSGAIRSQVDDQPVKVYKEGECWYEEPGAHHKLSENASATRPAKLLATFVVDAKDDKLTTPDPVK
jgi:quercetin dioxygenase-like cupin family protein